MHPLRIRSHGYHPVYRQAVYPAFFKEVSIITPVTFFLSAGDSIQDLFVLFLLSAKSSLFFTDPTLLFADAACFLSLGSTLFLLLPADFGILSSTRSVFPGHFTDPVATVTHTV